jgi:leucyl/phenylalanyl-tRNA---protein transferase
VPRPQLIRHGDPVGFPNPAEFDNEGLIAVGADLSREWLLKAYDSGIFPWYSDGYPPLWWSPNPRAVLPLDGTHISRSMRRRLRRDGYRVTWNQAFEAVIHCCAERGEEGTWLLPEMVDAYIRLHESGHAHSIEVWMEGEVVGGLYGVQRGSFFAAESMFHRRTDASKIALLYCASNLRTAGVELLDVQFLTPHLASLGAIEIPRSEYLQKLRQAQKNKISLMELDLAPPV